MTSFYFKGLRKCFLEKSIRLEVLLAALFPTAAKRKLFSAFRDWVKRLQKCVSVKGEYFENLYKNMFDKK